MSYLDEWLANIEEHLNSVSKEDLKQGYLAVRNGCGTTIEQYLNSDELITSFPDEFVFLTEKNLDSTIGYFQVSIVDRVALKFNNIPTVDSNFMTANDDFDYAMVA